VTELFKQTRSWSKPEYKDLIGRKKVDWSIFRIGTQIPYDFWEDFDKANGNQSLKVGERVPIHLLINGQTYQAHLVNRPRNDASTSSLQLRYDENKALQDLLRQTFKTSYQFLRKNRSDTEKKPIQVPDELAEYIDFYQTNKPFVYQVIFQTHDQKKPKPSFWWVNQGKTHHEEKEGSFLWVPQKSQRDTIMHHHIRLLEAHEGDIVFCYSEKEVKSVGIVTKEAIEAPKPSGIKSTEWQEDGYLLGLNYFDFVPAIQKDEIPLEWRIEERGPFNVKGDLNQGYFFNLSDHFVYQLFDLFEDRFPNEVNKMISPYSPSQEAPDIKESPKMYIPDNDLIIHIHHYITSKGFFYTKTEVANLYLSLRTKPFVILSGIPEQEKQKWQWFAESLGATEQNGQFTLIPIRPDWNDGSGLLGYTDIKGEFIEGPLTKVIKRAEEYPTLPYFVLLDEMNLARVEYYFSDILSVVESRRWEAGENISSNLFPKDEGLNLTLPINLYIIGTVNMDETTHPFSKKVLDRANTIEINRVELDHFSFLDALETVEPIPITQDRLQSKYLYLKDVFQVHRQMVEDATQVLVKINKALQLTNAQVGYRVRDEICFYLAYNEEDHLMEFNEALDHCILQKILPRIAGSDSRFDRMLKSLFTIFTNKQYDEPSEEDIENAKYRMSAEKVVEMLRRLEEDGFTSFWIS